MNTCGFFGSSFLAVSTVTMRCGSPTWIAARPTPGASYIVSNMSSTSARTSASTAFTGSDTCRSRLSGRMMMSRNAMRGDLSGAPHRVNRRGEIPASAPLARQFSTTATRLRRSAPVMVVTVAVVMTMVLPVSSAMVPGPVVHLLGASHVVGRRAEPGRRRAASQTRAAAPRARSRLRPEPSGSICAWIPLLLRPPSGPARPEPPVTG